MISRARTLLAGATIGAAFAGTPVLSALDPDAEQYWPQWRGPHASGTAPLADPPLRWSETTNIRWKVEIPGRGSSSPVVWGDRLFVQTAIPASAPAGTASHAPRGAGPREPHRFVLYAFDRTTGRVAWERTAREQQPHEASHQDNGTWASSSPVTDGEHVIAYFESFGLYAYTMDGTLVWQKDFGDKQMRNEFGEGSTPALHGDRLVVVWDHQGESFVAAFDKRTGTEVWRQRRDEIDSWATPIVVEHAGRAQVVTSGMNRLRSYDLETGALVWESQGVTMNPIPSPVAADGMVFVTSGFRGNNLKAIRLANAVGDITGTSSLAWELRRDTPYVPSPLLYDGVLYLLKTNTAVLSAFDARTGTPHFALQRLDGLDEVFSSPVGAGGRVYVTDRHGTTLVIRQGPKYEVLATNTLDDGFDASPAIAGNEIFMRGYTYLYAIAGQ
ncbi:MAG: PQQ-binding-like beta-propeller repeat protein [Vicinamibacterales bacterium]